MPGHGVRTDQGVGKGSSLRKTLFTLQFSTQVQQCTVNPVWKEWAHFSGDVVRAAPEPMFHGASRQQRHNKVRRLQDLLWLLGGFEAFKRDLQDFSAPSVALQPTWTIAPPRTAHTNVWAGQCTRVLTAHVRPGAQI